MGEYSTCVATPAVQIDLALSRLEIEHELAADVSGNVMCRSVQSPGARAEGHRGYVHIRQS